MSITKHSKMLQFVNYRMRVTLDDKRMLVGRFLAFDKHMNLVLADCEEHRATKAAAAGANNKAVEERRALGLVLVRGECVVSIAVDAAPPPKELPKPASVPSATPLGRGTPLPMGRGAGAPVPGLAGPAPGLGAGGAPPGFATAAGGGSGGRGMPPPPGFAQ